MEGQGHFSWLQVEQYYIKVIFPPGDISGVSMAQGTMVTQAKLMEEKTDFNIALSVSFL